MSKEKQIEETASLFSEFCEDELGAVFIKDIAVDFAERLYNAGYRKQSEGEWVSNCQTDEYICSLCGGFSPIDCEKENFYKSNFCPNCGAKMKGGAE